MTLTDEEKRAARGTDPRAAAIIDRSDLLPPEVFERLHGALRGVDIGPVAADAGGFREPDIDLDDVPTFGTAPWWDPGADAAVRPEVDTVVINGVEVGNGSRVRLHPSGHADAQDLFVDGLTAIVAGVYLDVDGGTHVAVTCRTIRPPSFTSGTAAIPTSVRKSSNRWTGRDPDTAVSGRALVAGVGNIFLRDDGFGSVAARRLAAAPWPDGVRIVDYGIRSLHLTYDLLDGYDVLVLLDATRRGGSPGEIVVLQVGLDDTAGRDSWPYADPHGMEPTSVLADLGPGWPTARRPTSSVANRRTWAREWACRHRSPPRSSARPRWLPASFMIDCEEPALYRRPGPEWTVVTHRHAPADHPAHRSAPPSATTRPTFRHPPARQDKEPSG